MKRLFVLLSVLMLILGARFVSAYDEYPPPEIQPPPLPPEIPSATVEKWGSFEYWCNGKEPIKIKVDVIQRIHQWLFIHWEPTLIEWDVYKPGDWASNCKYSVIESNGDVTLIITNNSPPGPPTHAFAISGPHPEPYHVPPVITTDEFLKEVIPDLTNKGLWLVPPVKPGQSSKAVVLPGCRRHVLKLWDYLEVPFHTKPGKYVGSAVITIIKEEAEPEPYPPVP